MGVREDIIQSLREWGDFARGIDRPGVDDVEREAARELYERDVPSFLRMVRMSVPIHVDVDGSTTFNVAWDFGAELSGFAEADAPDDGDQLMRIGYVRQPYDFCLYYGQFFPPQTGPRTVILVGTLGDENAHEVLVYPFQRFVPQDGSDTLLWAPVGAGVYASREFRRLIEAQNADFPVSDEFARLGDTFVLGQSRFTHPTLRGEPDHLKKAKKAVWAAIHCFVAAYGLLHMKQYDRHDVPAPEKLNAKRARSGKEAISHRVEIRLNPEYRLARSSGGTHASPRPHWRRGHVRTLSSGKRVAVSPHMVMGEAPLPQGYTIRK